MIDDRFIVGPAEVDLVIEGGFGLTVVLVIKAAKNKLPE